MDSVAYSWLVTCAVLLPLVASPLIYVVGQKSWRARNALSVASAALSTTMILFCYPVISRGGVISVGFPTVIPPLGLSFRLDALGFMMAAIASFIWLASTVYSVGYMEHEHRKKRYYTFLILALSGCLGVFVAGDLFTLFLFFELMSLSAYVLVIHEETSEAMHAGYKYLIMTIIGGLAIFIGIAVTYQTTGRLELGQGGLFTTTSAVALVGFIGYLLGFGIKAGMVPVHIWLPDAHPVAPSPASALLSGLMIKTGAYGLLRVIYDVYGRELIAAAGWNVIILWLAGITIFLGSAVAIVQDDLKRRLAYSSIGQMGYILLGMATLNQTAVLGAVFHIFSHAFMKSTLFLCAGAIIHNTGTRSVRELGGIGLRMPVTMGAFTAASLAMIGVPPFNAFLSKWQLSLGLLDVHMPALVGLLLLSSFMNMAYYMPIVISGFFAVGNPGRELRFHETPMVMLVPIVVLALGNILFNVLPYNVPLILSRMAAQLLFGGG